LQHADESIEEAAQRFDPTPNPTAHS